MHRPNRVIPSLHASGNRLDTITYSCRLANNAVGYARASNFAQTNRIGAEQHG
jgi:hypothetical protein